MSGILDEWLNPRGRVAILRNQEPGQSVYRIVYMMDGQVHHDQVIARRQAAEEVKRAYLNANRSYFEGHRVSGFRIKRVN